MKKQKRFWTWTERQKRKSRTQAKPGNYVPKAFRQTYNKKYKSQERIALRNELNGLDGDFPHRTRRHQGQWEYW